MASYDPAVMLSATEAVAVRALGGHAGEVVVTRDSGESWRATADLASLGVTRADALCFGTRRVGILVGRGGTVLRTADGGRSWRRHGRAPGGEGTRCQMFGGSRGYLVAGGALLVTADGGRRWRAVGRDLAGATDACFADSLRGVVLAASGVHRTSSGGRTWQEALARPGLSAVACLGRRRAWVGTESGRVLFSEDGGESWSAGVETGLAGVEWLAFASEQVGFAMGSAEDAARTEDGGHTWIPMELPAGSRAPSFHGTSLGYCVGAALHISSDRGASWTTADTEYAPPPEFASTELGQSGESGPDDESDDEATAEGDRAAGRRGGAGGGDESDDDGDAIYVNVGGRRIRVPRRR